MNVLKYSHILEAMRVIESESNKYLFKLNYLLKFVYIWEAERKREKTKFSYAPQMPPTARAMPG